MSKLKTKQEEQLEQRVLDLEQQLKYEKLRSRAFETMIKIAEEELKIPIRKKSGTEQ